MITLSEVIAVIQHQKNHLPPGAVARWAFLVTFQELDGLVDECVAHPEMGVQLEPAHAAHIKAGRAMMFINGTAVLPELEERHAQVS